MGDIAITVIGGYLGSGKTTLLNSMLTRAAGRRIGVVVNDFGDIGVDAMMLEGAADGGSPIVNLANGCVCCSLGDDLHATLQVLAAHEPPLDHVVVEASGVADPVATASWGTVPPFVPGGVVVLAAADTVRAQARDRYVGGEVQRQLVGADLLVLTKIDRCRSDDVADIRAWLGGFGDAPVVEAVHGDVALDLVLGPGGGSAGRTAPDPEGARAFVSPGPRDSHTDRYVRWSRASSAAWRRSGVERFVRELPPGVLRLKGVIRTADPERHLVVQVVGGSVEIVERPGAVAESAVVAIGAGGSMDPNALDQRADRILPSPT